MKAVLFVVEAGLAGGTVVLAIGILVYVFGSFFLMGPHAARRSIGATWKEMLREIFLAAITQPFLPIFYFVGRRMDSFLLARATAGKTPIIFVHGYMQNRVDFFGLMQWPAVSYLGLANNHGIHHRGQLSAYLRALGSKVPALYGGSADEPFQA